MPTVKLTDAAVQRLQAPPGERREYFDASLPGFGLRVAGPTPHAPEGRRSWVLFYRFGGKQKRLTLDPPYPAMSLAAARRKAGDALATVAEGKDPGAEKAQAKAEAARAPDTVANVVNLFILRHLEGKKRAPRYVEETRRNFVNHVLPRWADRDIRSITRRDVIELLDAVMDKGSQVRSEDGKRRHVPGGPISANRTLAAVRALFNWALRRGIIDSTPAALVERPGEETKRERALSADEIRVVWSQLADLGYPFGPFLQLALLTGQRRSELARMRWADLDLQERVWILPAAATKAGRTHVVPLSPLAVKVLKSVTRKTVIDDGATKPSPWVFTTTGAAPISGFSAVKRRLDSAVSEARKGTGTDDLPTWTLHDLRRSVATEMGRLGVSRFIIGKILNHSDRTVTGIYDRHSYLAEKRHALETWNRHLDTLTRPPGET